MKKLIATILMAFGLLAFAGAAEKSKSLVVYFSWSGTTESMANMIQKSTGAELWRIEPTKAYPTVYADCGKIVKEELDNGIIRKVKGAPDFSKYDTIFVGVPVWWHTAPTLVTNFLQEHSAELKGKTVIPFDTYDATYRDETLKALVDATPTAKYLEGYGSTNPRQADVDSWLKKIGVK